MWDEKRRQLVAITSDYARYAKKMCVTRPKLRVVSSLVSGQPSETCSLQQHVATHCQVMRDRAPPHTSTSCGGALRSRQSRCMSNASNRQARGMRKARSRKLHSDNGQKSAVKTRSPSLCRIRPAAQGATSAECEVSPKARPQVELMRNPQHADSVLEHLLGLALDRPSTSL